MTICRGIKFKIVYMEYYKNAAKIVVKIRKALVAKRL